jgi:hypothetical protein
VTYVGEFQLAADPPCYQTDAPESEDAPSKGSLIRQVLVFRLRPADTEPRPSESLLDELREGAVSQIPVEQQRTEKTFVSPSGETYEVERRDQQLILAYAACMAEKGSKIDRLLIRPTGEAKPLLNDVFDETRNNLTEAKGSAAAVRSEWRSASSPTTNASSPRHHVSLCSFQRGPVVISKNYSPSSGSAQTGLRTTASRMITAVISPSPVRSSTSRLQRAS